MFPSHIYIDGRLYMRRYGIDTPWGGIRLHHIVEPDPREPLHNHPFRWWWSVILWGGYSEVRTHAAGAREVTFTYLQGDENSMVGQHEYHRIEAVLPNTWTLFVYGPRVRRWGFLVDGRHVDAHDR